MLKYIEQIKEEGFGMIKTDVTVPIGYTLSDVKSALAARLPVSDDEMRNITVLRSELSVKDKSRPEYKLSVGLSLSDDRENGLLKMRKKVSEVPDYTLTLPKATLPMRPVVVGSGPCGLFAALLLAEAGARPIVIERGESVEKRAEAVRIFERYGILSPESNVQFGEGGAGTYSDGKLKVGGMDKYKMKVLTEFVGAGANDDIMHSTHAHLGTDKLSGIVRRLREKIISQGGEFIFSAKFTDFSVKGGSVTSVKYVKDGVEVDLPCSDVVLAIGHSARDTYELLNKKSAPMAARGFGIGMRIEHPREYINELVYGKNYDKRLETATYHLVTHLPSGRSVYSFCMCPGGSVVAAASEQGGIVTNGMSEYLRDGENSNAALLVSVTPDDFPSDSVLAGIELQRKIEGAAYRLAGEGYSAPAISAADFVTSDSKATIGEVKPSYPIGAVPVRPEKYLPDFITDSLRLAMSEFDSWMPGFYHPSAVFTGPETRTTAPVRILRDEKYALIGTNGIYPAGEGAGYSGGIVSSAVDGLKCAEAIIKKYVI